MLIKGEIYFRKEGPEQDNEHQMSLTSKSEKNIFFYILKHFLDSGANVLQEFSVLDEFYSETINVLVTGILEGQPHMDWY